MAEVKGKLLTCQRCGKSVFLKLIGKNHYDGGYTVTDKHEPRPSGWETYSIPKVYTDLCPTCGAEFERLCKAFMEEKTPAPAPWLWELDDDRETCGLLEED